MKKPRPILFALLLIILAVLVFWFVRGFAPERIAGPGEAPSLAATPEAPVPKE